MLTNGKDWDYVIDPINLYLRTVFNWLKYNQLSLN